MSDEFVSGRLCKTTAGGSSMSDEFVKLLRNPAFGADATDRKVMNEAADRIEHLHAMAVLDGDEIAKWREIVSGRTIGENYEAVWRERLKQSEAREAALKLKLAKAVELLNTPNQSDGKLGRYHYDWDRVDAALARITDTGGNADG